MIHTIASLKLGNHNDHVYDTKDLTKGLNKFKGTINKESKSMFPFRYTLIIRNKIRNKRYTMFLCR